MEERKWSATVASRNWFVDARISEKCGPRFLAKFWPPKLGPKANRAQNTKDLNGNAWWPEMVATSGARIWPRKRVHRIPQNLTLWGRVLQKRPTQKREPQAQPAKLQRGQNITWRPQCTTPGGKGSPTELKQLFASACNLPSNACSPLPFDGLSSYLARTNPRRKYTWVCDKHLAKSLLRIAQNGPEGCKQLFATFSHFRQAVARIGHTASAA